MNICPCCIAHDCHQLALVILILIALFGIMGIGLVYGGDIGSYLGLM